MWSYKYKGRSKRVSSRKRGMTSFKGRGSYTPFYTGRGSYKNFYKAVGAGKHLMKTLGIGKTAANAARNILGAAGAMATKSLVGGGSYRGRGAYKGGGNHGIYTNNLIGGSAHSGVATFQTVPDETETIIVKMEEFVENVYGSDTAWAEAKYSCQPGDRTVFSKGSQIMSNFTEYEPVQLIFTYRPITDTFGSNSSGAVGMINAVIQYDVNRGFFGNKHEMLDCYGSKSCRVTDALQIGVECEPSKRSGSKKLMVRNGKIGVGDLKSYDFANLHIAVSDIPAEFRNKPIGELWVSYTFKVSKMKMATNLGHCIDTSVFSYLWPGPDISPIGDYANLMGQNTNVLWSGKQNTVPCKLIRNGNPSDTFTSVDNSLGTANINGIPLGLVNGVYQGLQNSCNGMVFSPNLIGCFRITICAEHTGTQPIDNLQIFLQNGTIGPTIKTFGYCVPYNYLHLSYGADPGFYHVVSGVNSVSGNKYITGYKLEIYVQVTPSTGGAENAVTWVTNLAGGVVDRASIIVERVNPTLSSKFINYNGIDSRYLAECPLMSDTLGNEKIKL